MRGMLKGEWYDLEFCYFYGGVDWGDNYYSVKGDPERGTFMESDFEEFEP